MDAKQAAALREEFPPAAIGKLPKAGVMLDYVGHAATTDRLLKVDPTWTWEPLALDDVGLPAMDAAGNLWIRLTVAGVTRIGVGDGKNMKERIGDAIRNAAMRFGVALDLWAKEDLHAMGEERGEPEPAPAEPKRSAPSALVSQAQLSKMHASFNDLGLSDRDARLEYTNRVIKREPGHVITSSKELTKAEGTRLIEALASTLRAEPPPEEAS